MEGLYFPLKGQGIRISKPLYVSTGSSSGTGCSPPIKLCERDEARKRKLHLFSPPCSKQKWDDLCGASAAALRRGRILAFSFAPSRVARVVECAIAFPLVPFPFLAAPSFFLTLTAFYIGMRTTMYLSWMTCNYRSSFFT